MGIKITKMGMNESRNNIKESQSQQQTPISVRCNPEVYETHSPKHQPIKTTNISKQDINSRVALLERLGSHKLNHPTLSQSFTSPSQTVVLSLELPRSTTIKQRDTRAEHEPSGKPLKGVNNKVNAGRQTKQKAVQQASLDKSALQMHSYYVISSKSSGVPTATRSGPDLSLSSYPGYVYTTSYRNSEKVYPKVYPVESVRQKEPEQVNPQNSSSFQNIVTFATPHHKYNSVTVLPVGVDNDNSSLVSINTGRLGDNSNKLHLVEENRKLALKNLLIRPIIQMKGMAWDESEWWDFKAPHNFHNACTDFLSIIELTKNRKIALEIKNFLKSDLLIHKYIENQNLSKPAKKLNHFHVFWNIMHQLPYAVKRWDNTTMEKLILFYKVWVTVNLQCSYCRGHYQKWIKKYPPVVSDRTSLSQWLFRLHNDVNQRSSKPQFPWGMYKQRWGIGDHQPSNQAMNSRYNTPAKSTNSKSTLSSSSSLYGATQKSIHSKYGSYGRASSSWTRPTSSNVEVESDSSFFKFYQPVRKEPSTFPPGISLPRRCLSMQQLYLRRNRVSESKGSFIPRNRVSRRELSE